MKATRIASLVAGYARLLVPAIAAVLVGFALNASWHAIQGTLRMLDAPAELVLALPVILEPAALVYAGVWIVRKRIGGEVRVVRALFFVSASVAVVYNVAVALPLDVLLPSGSVSRMVALGVSAALAPLTVITVGHTALEEWAEWRASRRSLVDDVHAALEAEAQKALGEQLRGEFAAEVRDRVLAQLRADMVDRLGLPTATRRRRKALPSQSQKSSQLASHGNGHRETPAKALVPPDAARVVETYLAENSSHSLGDSELVQRIVDECGVSRATAYRYRSKAKEAA